MEYFDSVESISQEHAQSPIGHWQNWSSNQSCTPKHVFQPVSTSELASTLKEYSGKLRVVGSGHSFSPLVNSNDMLISLNQITGLIGSDKSEHTARVMAGTPLHQLGPLLESIDQSMLNLGDIDHQSIAGAITTGTHGTGAKLSCLSHLIKSMTLIAVDGSVIECSASHNRELFNAARVSLGALGIITEIELQNRPKYRLKESIDVVPLKEALTNIETWKHQHRHVELFAFGYSDQAILKTLNITEEAPFQAKAPLISDDSLLTLFCEVTRKAPKLTSLIHHQIFRFIKPSSRVDESYKALTSVRNVRFNEMEYQVSADTGPECFERIINHIQKHKLPAFFPIEYRYVAGDDIWLSPFYKRDSASISIHHYYKQDYHGLFGELEPIFDDYQGRPHWGKIHTKEQKQLSEMYPHWETFQAIRQELDPKNQLLNPALSAIFKKP